MTGAMIGLLLSSGLLLVASGWARTRRPSLDQRLSPYLRDVHPYAVVPGRSHSVVDAVFGPSVRRAGQVVGDLVGGSASVSRRLVRLGSTRTAEDFRIQQVLWGATGLAGAIGISALLWSERNTGVPVLLVICVVGFVSGVLMCDNHLSSRVKAHEQEL